MAPAVLLCCCLDAAAVMLPSCLSRLHSFLSLIPIGHIFIYIYTHTYTYPWDMCIYVYVYMHMQGMGHCAH